MTRKQKVSTVILSASDFNALLKGHPVERDGVQVTLEQVTVGADMQIVDCREGYFMSCDLFIRPAARPSPNGADSLEGGVRD